MTVINTNIRSLISQESSRSIGLSQDISMQRLSTGLRINSAKDDAAGLSISTRMTSQIRGLSMAIKNANDGISLMQTAEGALQEVTDNLQRMRELAVQAANGVNNDSDRSDIDKEIQQLKNEIERIATTTQFNNINILDGTFKNKQLQIGDKANQTLSVSINSARVGNLGIGSAGGGNTVLVGGRWSANAHDANDKTAISADFADNTTISLVINGVAINKIDVNSDNPDDGTLDLADVISAINATQETQVTASSFNEVRAKFAGNGVLDYATTFEIEVTPWGDNGTTGTQTIVVSGTNSLQDMVDKINEQGSPGTVQARIDETGRLVLFNNTGYKMSVTDNSDANADGGGASGIQDGDEFNGFLKLESKTGAPISVDTNYIALGATEDDSANYLHSLGLQRNVRQVTGTEDPWDAYTVIGQNLADAQGKWENGELYINGVNIFREGQVSDDSYDATQSDEGAINQKVALINSFTEQTGVRASAYYNEEDGAWGLILKSQNAISIDVGDQDSAAPAYAGKDSHGFIEQNVGASDYDPGRTALSFGAMAAAVGGLNVKTAQSATSAIKVIDGAIQMVSSSRADLGALENRLNNTVNNLTNVVTNTTASRSRIQDADYGKETTNLARAQIIAQAATAMLAQANQSSQLVLSLLK